ncbi:hypothetical protein [Thermococcus aciditolerans]|uniref:Uncharacterized protein n=1 Tax=Thermococcus aciditolerans TaxID=2598455 RepID=A0A5C0SMT3_9EURY|nr:hypothetical protein [Thermococcus aciditolerans]QEK15661.1 hypothetical protein FPV09_11870 [Thermococcus aciditolerans]
MVQRPPLRVFNRSKAVLERTPYGVNPPTLEGNVKPFGEGVVLQWPLRGLITLAGLKRVSVI